MRIFGQISGRIPRLSRARMCPERKLSAYPRRADGCASADEIVRRAWMNLPHCADGARKAWYFQNPKTNYVVFPTELGWGISKAPAQRPCLGRFRGGFCGYSARAVPTGAPALPETVRRALLIHVSAGSVGFADARRPRHDRADAAFARRRALPPLRIRQPSADCGFYLAIIRKRTTHTGASFVVLRCSSAAVAHSDCPLAARLLHRFRHCRRFARPPQGEDTPFPKEKSGPEIFPSRFSYSVYRFRQIPNPGR